MRQSLARMSSQEHRPLLFQYLMWILRTPTHVQQHLGSSRHCSEECSTHMYTTAKPSPQIDNLVGSTLNKGSDVSLTSNRTTHCVAASDTMAEKATWILNMKVAWMGSL